MPHYLDKSDPWEQRLGVWVLVGMAFSLPLIAWGVSRLRMDTGADRWVADTSLPARQWKWVRQNFPDESDLFVSWDDSSLEDPRVERLAARLAGKTDSEGVRRGGVKQIASVTTPLQSVGRMVQAKVDRNDAIQRLTGVLVGPGRIWCNFSTAGLNQKAKSIRTLKEATAERFGIALTIVEPTIILSDESSVTTAENSGATEESMATQDTGSTNAEAAGATSEASDSGVESPETPLVVEEAAQHDLELSWPEMHRDPAQVKDFMAWVRELKLRVAGGHAGEPLLAECYLHPAQPVAIAISLSEAGHADRSEALAQIRTAAASVGIRPDSLHLAGPAVDTVAVQQQLQKALWNTEAAWYEPLERSILLTSILAGFVLLVVMVRDVRIIGIVLLTSLFAALAPLAFISFSGARLDLVTLILPMLALAVTVPGALNLASRDSGERSRGATRLTLVQDFFANRLVCAAPGIAVAIVCGSLLLSPTDLLQDFGLYSFLGAGLSALLVSYAIPAVAQAWPTGTPVVTPLVRHPWTAMGRRLVRHSRSITAACLVLGLLATIGSRHLRIEARVIRQLPANAPTALDGKFVEEHLLGLVPFETVVCFGKTSREESKFLQRLEVIRAINDRIRKLTQVSGTVSLADFEAQSEPLEENASGKKLIAYDARSQEVESRMTGDLRLKNLFTVAANESEFSAAGDELWRISTQVALMTKSQYQDLTTEIDQACRSVTKYHPDTKHVVTGVVPASLAPQFALGENVFYSLPIGVIGIAAFGVLLSRSILASLLSLIPVLGPVGIVWGLASWFGVPLDAGMFVSAVTGLAVAMYGTFQMIHSFRGGVAAGLSRRRAVVKCVEQSSPSLWGATLPVALVMLVLGQSSTPFIGNFAFVTGAYLLLSMAASLLLTPALLTEPLGWLIFRAAEKQRNRLKTVSEDPESGAPMRHEPHLVPPKPTISEDPRNNRAHRFDNETGTSRKKRK